jgi:hypothetical protein
MCFRRTSPHSESVLGSAEGASEPTARAARDIYYRKSQGSADGTLFALPRLRPPGVGRTLMGGGGAA